MMVIYQNAEEKALDKFTDLVIDKLQDLQTGLASTMVYGICYFCTSKLNGRQYNGYDSVMLMLLCQKNKYDSTCILYL
jgi:hypothetical protein